MRKYRMMQITAVILLVISCICVHIQKNRLYDQQAAKRWAETGMEQITFFYPADKSEGKDEMYFLNLCHTIERAYESSSIASELNINEEGLCFPYAVSNTGTVDIYNGAKKVTATAIGVMGDYALFHPMALTGGAYIGGDELMEDGIVIDENAAWELFGSDDVVGMQVEIGGIPHFVRGVVKKPDDRFSKAAGLDGTVCFTSLNSLGQYGTISGSYCFETVLPEPVDGFAMKLLTDTLPDLEKEYKAVDNTARFKAANLRSIIKDFGIRSMNDRGIIYPYHENTARAYEDVFAAVYVIQVILTIIIVITVIIDIRHIRKGVKWKDLKKFCASRLSHARQFLSHVAETKTGGRTQTEQKTTKRSQKKRKTTSGAKRR